LKLEITPIVIVLTAAACRAVDGFAVHFHVDFSP
jgi:hypothetical protein